MLRYNMYDYSNIHVGVKELPPKGGAGLSVLSSYSSMMVLL